jgi:hypothetical protein
MLELLASLLLLIISLPTTVLIMVAAFIGENK